jgi:hypothetical protein
MLTQELIRSGLGFPRVIISNPLEFSDLRTENRTPVDLLGSAEVAALVADQHTALTAVHAYSVERSVPGASA